MTPAIAMLLALLPAAGAPRQDSTNAQIADVEAFLAKRNLHDVLDLDKTAVANRLGMYDAADIFKLRATRSERSSSGQSITPA